MFSRKILLIFGISFLLLSIFIGWIHFKNKINKNSQVVQPILTGKQNVSQELKCKSTIDCGWFDFGLSVPLNGFKCVSVQYGKSKCLFNKNCREIPKENIKYNKCSCNDFGACSEDTKNPTSPVPTLNCFRNGDVLCAVGSHNCQDANGCLTCCSD